MNLTPVIAYEYHTTLEQKVGKDAIPFLGAKVVGTAIGAGTAGGGAAQLAGERRRAEMQAQNTTASSNTGK